MIEKTSQSVLIYFFYNRRMHFTANHASTSIADEESVYTDEAQHHLKLKVFFWMLGIQ